MGGVHDLIMLQRPDLDRVIPWLEDLYTLIAFEGGRCVYSRPTYLVSSTLIRPRSNFYLYGCRRRTLLPPRGDTWEPGAPAVLWSQSRDAARCLWN